MMIFVFPQRNDDKHLVFFPLQSTLRIMCFMKFPMPGNFQYLIVDVVPVHSKTEKLLQISIEDLPKVIYYGLGCTLEKF